MESEFDMIISSLKFEYGYFLGFSAWVTCLRAVFVFINTKIMEFAENALPAENASIQKWLNSLSWRLLAFTLNMLASIKLPTTARGGTQTNPAPSSSGTRGLHSILFLVGLLAVSWLPSGCATATARAYQSLYTVGHVTDSAVKSYFDLVVAGRLPTNDVPRITRSYESFQLLYRTALAVAQFNPTATAPTNVTASAAAVLETISSAKGGR